MLATDLTMEPHDLAREAEDRGFASLHLPEHTHIPVSRRTPSPTGTGDLPTEYARTLDPLVALAAAAAVTGRITLGTGIPLPAQREPIVTAKAVATLDRLAGGRFTLGVGYGWNAEEGADHGVPWKRRRAMVREHVLAMRALWTETRRRSKASSSSSRRAGRGRNRPGGCRCCSAARPAPRCSRPICERHLLTGPLAYRTIRKQKKVGNLKYWRFPAFTAPRMMNTHCPMTNSMYGKANGIRNAGDSNTIAGGAQTTATASRWISMVSWWFSACAAWNRVNGSVFFFTQ